MLGDKSVYGEFPVTIDDKNRMIIPARTGIEYNEDILIVSINSNRYVVSQRVFDEYINKLDESIATAPTELDFRSLMDLKDYLCSMIIKQCRADKQHRILVTDVYEPKGQAKVRGMGRYLKLID